MFSQKTVRWYVSIRQWFVIGAMLLASALNRSISSPVLLASLFRALARNMAAMRSITCAVTNTLRFFRSTSLFVVSTLTWVGDVRSFTSSFSNVYGYKHPHVSGFVAFSKVSTLETVFKNLWLEIRYLIILLYYWKFYISSFSALQDLIENSDIFFTEESYPV